MKPFLVSEPARRLIELYPDSVAFRETVAKLARQELSHVVQLWVTEGIPFAFRHAPMLYESVRSWLSAELHVHPKFITLVGSGRVGYSLSPPPAYGQQYGPHSDLDFIAISEDLHAELAETFYRWKREYLSRIVRPRNKQEEFYWSQNADRVPTTLARGFIDSMYVPTLAHYAPAVQVQDALFRLHKKLSMTPECPAGIACKSLRVYQDWKSCVNQVAHNLLDVCTK
jgi:hypothetical protein